MTAKRTCTINGRKMENCQKDMRALSLLAQGKATTNYVAQFNHYPTTTIPSDRSSGTTTAANNSGCPITLGRNIPKWNVSKFLLDRKVMIG